MGRAVKEMRIIIFGVTGMVGQSALRECLENDDVQEILAISRKGTNQRHEKLRLFLRFLTCLLKCSS